MLVTSILARRLQNRRLFALEERPEGDRFLLIRHVNGRHIRHEVRRRNFLQLARMTRFVRIRCELLEQVVRQMILERFELQQFKHFLHVGG